MEMSLAERIEKYFPEGVVFPPALAQLCDWAEAHDAAEGGALSGGFWLAPDEGNAVRWWFGREDVADAFGVFATDWDGSLYAIWQPEGAAPRVVFLGGEGEPLLVLAHDFVDFLRLLAIGYDEPGASDLRLPPAKSAASPAFVQWVQESFGGQIPPTGDAIVDTADESFADWVKARLV